MSGWQVMALLMVILGCVTMLVGYWMTLVARPQPPPLEEEPERE